MAHLFIQSPAARRAWDYFGTIFNVAPLQTEYVHHMLQAWRLSSPFVRGGHARLLVPIIVLWSIWKLQNEANLMVLSHIVVVYKSHLFKLEHRCGDLDVARRWGFIFTKLSPPNPKLVRWLHPELGWHNLNYDGAAKGNPGEAGGGGLMRNAEGNIIVMYYVYLGVQTNYFAELAARVKGLEIAAEEVYSLVWVELDTLAVIWMIQSGKGPWYTQLLARICILRRTIELRFTHIFREGNKAADYLANLACT
ncbi:UNVERIFIED_CONTAM: hypothetical protein Sradi_0009900 [Sesamum radiatum]|uniref:RNase H type-1 domain-containing protein n=1 Tax=Sesamum radiatum TaxID=300843 RepID=A0AAW2WFW3_SESRA